MYDSFLSYKFLLIFILDFDDCDPNPCHNNGNCKDLMDDFSCTCPRGFKGKTCGVNIDECASNPCRNGGQCKDLDGGFVCRCQRGFSGETCTKSMFLPRNGKISIPLPFFVI